MKDKVILSTRKYKAGYVVKEELEFILSGLYNSGFIKGELDKGDEFKSIEEAQKQILSLLSKEEEAIRAETACNLFEEIICPMCYRLNPQHATMDNGKGCHYCQEREDWQALKESKGE